MSSLFQQMLAAEQRAAKTRKSFLIAIAVSLAAHAIALFYYLLLPKPPAGAADTKFHVNSPLQASLRQRAQAAPPQPPKPVVQQERRKTTRTEVVTSKQGKWSSTSKPAPLQPSGAELAQRALAMARGMGSTEQDGGDDRASTRQDGKGKEIEPLSLQWYFDSFITKLNRSARFVPRTPRQQGQRKALVEIIINRDGSLREYRIIRAADQQEEIGYIKAVVDRAVPFAAFPPDIRQKTDTLSLMMCINPPGEGGGFGFSRTSGPDC